LYEELRGKGLKKGAAKQNWAGRENGPMKTAPNAETVKKGKTRMGERRAKVE